MTEWQPSLTQEIDELFMMLMPDERRRDSIEAWKEAAKRCFNVLVGMYLSSKVSSESIKQIIESLHYQEIKAEDWRKK